MPKAKLAPPRPRTLSDPLAAALIPPPNESPEDRTKRIQSEIDAKRISEIIDQQLQQERTERKKVRPEVNVLLLGQSESGKSTTLKREFAATVCSGRASHRISLVLRCVGVLTSVSILSWALPP